MTAGKPSHVLVPELLQRNLLERGFEVDFRQMIHATFQLYDFRNGQILNQDISLRHHTDLSPVIQRGLDVAGVCGDLSRNNFQERAFSGTVIPQESDSIALLDGKRNSFQDLFIRIRFLNLFYFKHVSLRSFCLLTGLMITDGEKKNRSCRKRFPDCRER